MAVAISNLLPDVRLELPGAPNPVLEAAVYRVLRQFFWDSEAWKYTSDNRKDWAASTNFPTFTAGTDIPAKTVVKRADTVKYASDGADFTPIPFKTRDHLDQLDQNWEVETGSTPRYWTFDNAAEARIIPLATATVSNALQVRLVIAPVFTALDDTLPDLLYYENEEALKAGILFQLMKKPGKDWTNLNAAASYGAIFRAGIQTAKSRAEAGYGQPVRTTTYGGL